MLAAFRSVPVRSFTVIVSAPPSAARFSRWIPLRSIVTAPTSLNSRTREPFAETSMFSLAFEPLKSSASVPVCPSTVSLPSLGFQVKVRSLHRP
jgi:hypothetical protein